MGMSLSLMTSIGVFFGGGCDISNDIPSETRESTLIDPFEVESIVVNYEDLSNEERKAYDEFRNARHPGDAPGLRKIVEYYYPYYDKSIVDPGTMMFNNGKYVELK